MSCIELIKFFVLVTSIDTIALEVFIVIKVKIPGSVNTETFCLLLSTLVPV